MKQTPSQHPILVPTDFSDCAANAASYACALASTTGQKLILFHAFSMLTYPYDEATIIRISAADLAQAAHKKLEDERKKLIRKFPDLNIVCLADGSMAVDAILDTARRHKAAFIVMGTRGASNLDKSWFGSNTLRVFRNTTCPVLAIPDNARYRKPQTLVYATDLKKYDVPVVKKLAAFAGNFNASLRVMHVDPMKSDAKTLARFAKLKQYVTYPKLHTDIIESLDETGTIRAYTEKHKADILAVATYPRSFTSRIFHSSVTKKLHYQMDLPLLVYYKNTGQN